MVWVFQVAAWGGWSKLALARLSAGLLGHISVLAVRTAIPASACCNVGSVTSDCILVYIFLC